MISLVDRATPTEASVRVLLTLLSIVYRFDVMSAFLQVENGGMTISAIRKRVRSKMM